MLHPHLQFPLALLSREEGVLCRVHMQGTMWSVHKWGLGLLPEWAVHISRKAYPCMTSSKNKSTRVTMTRSPHTPWYLVFALASQH